MSMSVDLLNCLSEATSSLRNALSYAARQERPIVCTQIANLISEIDSIGSFDGIMDKLEEISNEKDS